MRDPYLYPDVNVLINRAGIKDPEVLRKAEADITNLSMTAIYDKGYEKFNAETLCDIHRMIFGQIYDWAGGIAVQEGGPRKKGGLLLHPEEI